MESSDKVTHLSMCHKTQSYTDKYSDLFLQKRCCFLSADVMQSNAYLSLSLWPMVEGGWMNVLVCAVLLIQFKPSQILWKKDGACINILLLKVVNTQHNNNNNNNNNNNYNVITLS